MKVRASTAPVKRRARLAFLAVCLGFCVASLDAMAVNVALPHIREDLGGPLSGLQWVVNGYVVVFAGLLLSGGALGDRLGQKRVYLSGLVLFAIGAPLCSVSPTLEVLVAARVLEGVGAALLLPTSFGLITHTFPDARERAHAIGIWMGATSIAGLTGPAIGGVLVDTLGWRSIFLIGLPVIAVSMFLAARYVVETPTARGRAIDWPGQMCAVVALASLILGLSKAHDLGWMSAPIVGSFGVSAAAAVMFVVVERRSEHPMLPLDVFTRPNVAAASVLAIANLFTMFGTLFVLTLYLQGLRGYSALATGFALMPASAVGFPMTVFAGRVTARRGPRVPLAAGFALGAVGALVLMGLGAQTPYWHVALGLLLAGAGTALAVPAILAAVALGVPAERAGVAGGLVNASRQTGGALGVAVLGTVLAASGPTNGPRVCFALIAGVFALASVVAVRFITTPRIGR